MTINSIIAELQKLVEHHGDDVLVMGLDSFDVDPPPLVVKAYKSGYNSDRMIVSMSVGANVILAVSTDRPK